MDPAHIPFAHHGLQGTRKDAQPINLEVTSARDSNSISFEFQDRTMGKDRDSKFTFLAPFLAYYRGMMNDAGAFRLTFVCVPVSPGCSRLVLLYGEAAAHATKKRSMMSRLPTFFIHLFSGRFLDSDLVFLHMQERTLRTGVCQATKWQTAYFMPAKVDQAISAFRRYLDREGARCVTDGQVLPPTPPREQLLSRWEQHTKCCRHCLTALEGISKWQWRLGKVGLAALVLDRTGAASLVLDRVDSSQRTNLSRFFTGAFLSCQLLAVAFIASAHTFKQSFYYVDYEHYKK